MLELFTEIESVNIFRNGAEVTRKGQVELEEGSQTLYVHGLTSSSRTDTARLFAPQGIACSNLRFISSLDDERESESDKLNNEIEALKKQIEVKQLQISLWQSNGDFSKKESLNTSEIESYIEKLPERLEALNKDIADLEKQIRDLEKKTDEAQAKDELILMVADVYAQKEGNYPFELRYHENSAGWTSVYEVHSDAKEDIQIKMRARIYENTHEDWKGVKVSLFTGNPSAGDTLPELSPVYLDVREKEQVVRSSMKMSRNMMMSAAMGAAGVMADEEALAEYDGVAPMEMVAMDEAEVNSDETMTEYVLPGVKDIFKNGEATMADIQTHTIPSEYKIVTVAKADPYAYLVASIKTADLPFTTMVRGDIYLNGMYTGSTVFDPDLNKETKDITLGREERVHVSYKELGRKSSTTLLKGQKVVEHAYETKIANGTDNEIKVTVRDQIPVSENKEVTVEVLDLSGTRPDEKTGLLEKELSIPAKGNVVFKTSYKVAYPKDKVLNERAGRKTCPQCGAEVYGRFCPECGAPVY